MTDHIVIQRPEFTGVVDGSIEFEIFSRCMKHDGGPYERVHPDERVWIKWTGKPIIATGLVKSAEHFPYSKISQVRNLTSGFLLFGLSAWWDAQPRTGYATIVHIRDIKWLTPEIVPGERSYGPGWIVLDSERLREDWLGPRPEVHIP